MTSGQTVSICKTGCRPTAAIIAIRSHWIWIVRRYSTRENVIIDWLCSFDSYCIFEGTRLQCPASI